MRIAAPVEGAEHDRDLRAALGYESPQLALECPLRRLLCCVSHSSHRKPRQEQDKIQRVGKMITRLTTSD